MLLRWEGSVADGRVLRDAIRRRHGLKDPAGVFFVLSIFVLSLLQSLALSKTKWTIVLMQESTT